MATSWPIGFSTRCSAPFCSPNLAERPPRLGTVEDLAHAPLIRWDLSHNEAASNTRRLNFWRYWLSAVGADHVIPSEGPRFSDYNLAIQVAIAGHGFIIGSQPILRHLVEGGFLVNPFDIWLEAEAGYAVVATRSALVRQDVVTFIEWIRRETAGGDAAQGAGLASAAPSSRNHAPVE